jgi:ElaB/YqjD/DUF883 family membrane-anchored ribosome-binding protein
MADRTATTEQDLGQSQDTAQASGRWNQAQDLGTQIRDRVQELGAQVQELAQEIGIQAHDWAQEVGGQLKEGAQEAMRQMETSTSQLSAQGQEAVGQLEKSLEGYIRAKPLQSLLIAAGVGVVLGLLWRK